MEAFNEAMQRMIQQGIAQSAQGQARLELDNQGWRQRADQRSLASAASDLMPEGFTVESTPTIAVTAAPEPGTTLAPPPPSSGAPPDGAASSPLGLALGAGGAAAVLLGLLLMFYAYRKRRSKMRRAKTGQLISTSDVNVEEAATAADVAFQPPLSALSSSSQPLPPPGADRGTGTSSSTSGAGTGSGFGARASIDVKTSKLR